MPRRRARRSAHRLERRARRGGKESTQRAHWAEIDLNHQRALATAEVLITLLGSNVFDDFGKTALFGRCFMFMDAQHPRMVKIERKAA